MMLFPLAIQIFVAVLSAITVLAQPSPPAQGIQLVAPTAGFDIRFPLTVTQCEPVFIYYNIIDTINHPNGVILSFEANSPPFEPPLLHTIGPFSGTGYAEWICNIPAGYRFRVSTGVNAVTSYYILVVQPGSTLSCLGNITTTYQYMSYDTTAWTSYTAIMTPGPPTQSYTDVIYSALPYIPERLATSTVPFPTGPFSTITINPELIVATPLPSPTPPSHSPSPTTSTSSRKSRAPAIAGGVIGALVITVAFALIFIRLRMRRTPRLGMADEPIATSPSAVYPGWAVDPSAPASIPKNTSMPTSNSAIPSTFGWDPSMLPVEASSASNVRQAPLHFAGASVPASHTQPVSGTGAGPDSTTADTVSTLNTFSRLPPERMRALLPILTDMVSSRQPAEALGGEFVPGAPPSYT